MNWSLPAGRAFGIPIRVHWTLLALCAFWVLTEATPREMGWKLAVCAVLFLTVLVHELGHAFAARAVGGQAHSIMLWPLGGLAYTSHQGRLVDDIKVVLGGPLTHIPLAFLFARLLMFLGVDWDWAYLHPLSHWETAVGGFWVYLCMYGLKIQVGMFLFNLFMPMYPLDGGRLLLDLLLFRFTRETAAKVIMVMSVLCGVALLFLGARPFLLIWVLFEVYQLGVCYKSGQLNRHPLFARVPDRPVAKTRKPSGGGVVLQFRKRDDSMAAPATGQRECPFCKRSLPREAKMCGPCEKMLPPL